MNFKTQLLILYNCSRLCHGRIYSLFPRFYNSVLAVFQAFKELYWDVEMHALNSDSPFVIKGRYMMTCAPASKQTTPLQKKEANASETFVT